MSKSSKRSTVYFEEEIHQALRTKAATTHQTVSEVVNEAVRVALREDPEDLNTFNQRMEDPILSHEELLENLKAHGTHAYTSPRQAVWLFSHTWSTLNP